MNTVGIDVRPIQFTPPESASLTGLHSYFLSIVHAIAGAALLGAAIIFGPPTPQNIIALLRSDMHGDLGAGLLLLVTALVGLGEFFVASRLLLAQRVHVTLPTTAVTVAAAVHFAGVLLCMVAVFLDDSDARWDGITTLAGIVIGINYSLMMLLSLITLWRLKESQRERELHMG